MLVKGATDDSHNDLSNVSICDILVIKNNSNLNKLEVLLMSSIFSMLMDG